MTNEAIEAAARAIWEQQCQHWGRYRDSIPDLCAWEELSESKQRELIREARAAAPALMEEGARLALEAAIEHLEGCYANAMENGYNDHAQGVCDATDELHNLDPAAIVKGAGHDRD